MKGILREDIEKLVSSIRMINLKVGDIIIKQGDHDKYNLYIIYYGSIFYMKKWYRNKNKKQEKW